MLNIISNEYFKPEKMVSGPLKVFRNLIKGLELIKYPFVINAHPEACDRLWIYNDPLALLKIKSISSKIKILLGPVFISERLIKPNIKEILDARSEQIVCLQPSKWSKEMLSDFGYNHTRLEAWPVGIDTDEFKPEFSSDREFVTVYFKQRFDLELESIKKVLENKKIKYQLLIYGKYNEKGYKDVLKNTKYMIWLGRQESQGIALEEALAFDVPVLVWDVKKVGHWVPPEKDAEVFTKAESEYTNTTSVPYFDERCGVRFLDGVDLEKQIMFMEDNFKNFRPRDYIVENLSLAKQAKEFVSIFEKNWSFDINASEVDERLLKKKWKNEFLWKNLARAYYFFK